MVSWFYYRRECRIQCKRENRRTPGCMMDMGKPGAAKRITKKDTTPEITATPN
jgi:hypothetical protein